MVDTMDEVFWELKVIVYMRRKTGWQQIEIEKERDTGRLK